MTIPLFDLLNINKKTRSFCDRVFIVQVQFKPALGYTPVAYKYYHSDFPLAQYFYTPAHTNGIWVMIADHSAW
ncbi:MAG: hypothetical protein ACHQFX_09160 [Chitinophagales bacterium]